MPEDELPWIEKYRAALNQRTAKPRGLLEAIARALVWRWAGSLPEGSAPQRYLRKCLTQKAPNLHRSLGAKAGVQISASAQMSTMLLES